VALENSTLGLSHVIALVFFGTLYRPYRESTTKPQRNTSDDLTSILPRISHRGSCDVAFGLPVEKRGRGGHARARSDYNEVHLGRSIVAHVSPQIRLTGKHAFPAATKGMLVVLITHLGDHYLAVPLCEHIRRLGGVKAHECLIVSPIGTPMQGIEDILRGTFGTVYTHQYAASLKGWPAGANEAAEAAMMYVAGNPMLRYHYLMLEPDCVPTTPEWLNRIDTAYRRVGQGVMGESIATQEMAPPHKIVGRHVIGVAVYPKNFAAICPLVRGISAMSVGYAAQGALPYPWDAYIGPYTMRMLTETKLIQHLARQMFQTPDGPKFDCPSLEHALGQVRGDAVLIHGCKIPEFLSAVTKTTSPTYATQERDRHIGETNHENASPKPEIPQRHEEVRLAGDGQNGARQPEAPLAPAATAALTKEQAKEQKRIARQKERDLASAMKIRKELEIEAMPFTPEWRRTAFLHTEMPWPKLRAYASRLGAGGFGKGNSKNAIINRVVRIEKEQQKEPWTKDLPISGSKEEPSQMAGAQPSEANKKPSPEIPVEEAPPIPPGSFPVSQLQTTVTWGAVDKSGRVISEPQPPEGPTMEEKMKALMARRMAGV
jgi:hypothetical protein